MSGVWCIQYTLPERRISSVVPRSSEHESVRALVVRDGNPLGYVQFVPEGGELGAAELDRHAREQLGDVLDHDVSSAAPLGPDDKWPFVSVIVCTRNRPDELADCLQALSALDYPDYEVVVVDNAPTDDRTRDVVGRHARARYVVEPTPGLSHARNRGLAEMTGEIAAFTDDDVAVDPHWLREVVQAFAADDNIGCVTGLVCTADIRTVHESYFDARAWNWSSDFTSHTNSIAQHDLGPLFPYTPGKFGTGANFAFKRKTLEDISGFDVALGAGTPTGGGEDLDAFVRVLLTGQAISYTPRAIVWHHHRADARALRKQMFSWGVGLGSFVLAHLSRRETRGMVLKRIGSGFGQLGRTVRTERDRAKQQPTVDPPRGLMVVELSGMVLSPYYYARSRSRARGAIVECNPQRVTISLLGVLSFVVFAIAAMLAPPAVAVPAGFAALIFGVGSGATVIGRKDGIELGAAGAIGLGFALWVLGGMVLIETEFWHPTVLTVVLIGGSLVLHGRVLVPAWRNGTVRALLRRAAHAVNPDARAGLVELVGLACVTAFGYALYQARHTRIGYDVPIGGYLGQIGAWWYVSLAAIIAAIVFYAARGIAGGVMFAGLQLVVAVFAVPILTYSVPRSPSAQKHIDIVSYFIAHGHVTGIAGIYADWNGFFTGIAAALDGVGDSSDRLRLATYWPLLMALTTFAIVVALCRVIGYDRLTRYLVGTVACIANVLQQDYFSPQSMGYVLALCLIVVCVANPRHAAAPEDLIAPSRRHPGYDMRWWQVCYALIIAMAIGWSHQFTPFAIAGAIGVLVLWGSIRPFKRGIVLAVVVTAPVVVWAFIHFDIISDFLSPAQLGNASNFSTPETKSAAGVERLPIVAQSSLALLFTLLLIGLIAVLGGIRVVRNRTTLALGSAAIFAFSLILITPYGNEGIFRASLFAVPWLIILGLPAYRALTCGGWIKSLTLGMVLVLLTGFYLVSSAGLDASNVARPADAAVYKYVSRVAARHPNTVYAVLQMGPGDVPTNLPVAPGNTRYLQPIDAIPALPTVNRAQQYLHRKFVDAYRYLLQANLLDKGEPFVEYVFYSPASVAYAREYGQARVSELENIRQALYVDPEQNVLSVHEATVLARVRQDEWLRHS